jgi:hypothetical protein
MSYNEKEYYATFTDSDPPTDARKIDTREYTVVYTSNGPKAAADDFVRQHHPGAWKRTVVVVDPKGGRVFAYWLDVAPRLSPYTPAGAVVSA